MKTIIAGSRSITDLAYVINAVATCPWTISEVVSGGANGVDSLGEQYANLHGIPIAVFPADWIRFRRAAGSIRNQQMAEHAEALLAVWDGKSRGTADMIRRAKSRKLRVMVVAPPPILLVNDIFNEFEYT